MIIGEATHSNIDLINTTDSSFEVTSKLVVNFHDGKFSYHIVPVHNRMKSYVYDEMDYSVYITDENKKIFFLFNGDNLAGQIILFKYWNGYCYINDIRIDKNYRGKGIGKLLIQKAIEWAKEKNCIGMQVETQDVNVNACKFYERLGFTLGGVDLFRYKSSKTEKDEIALDWYLLF
jgi:GNAT superfamily N-acetyltransferase